MIRASGSFIREVLRRMNRGVASTYIVTTDFSPLRNTRKNESRRPDTHKPWLEVVCDTGTLPHWAKSRTNQKMNRGVASGHIVTTDFSPLKKTQERMRAVGSAHLMF